MLATYELFNLKKQLQNKCICIYTVALLLYPGINTFTTINDVRIILLLLLMVLLV